MLLGYIISEEIYDFGERFVCGSYEDSLKYPDLPKLIVGMALADEISDEETDILDRVLVDGTFWTFTKKEQRKYHNEDAEDFKQHCYDKLLGGFEYEFLDPLMESYEEHKVRFDNIKGDSDLVTYHNRDMVYIDTGAMVYGLNLMFYEFLGSNRADLIDKLKDISSVFLSGEDIIIEYKDYMDRFDNEERYIPYLYSMVNYVK